MALIGIVKNKPQRHDWLGPKWDPDALAVSWYCQRCCLEILAYPTSPTRNEFAKLVLTGDGTDWEATKELGSCLPLGYDDVPD